MQVPQPSPDQTSSSPAREGSISHAVPPADNANANAQRCCTHTMPCGCNGFNMAPVLTFLPLLSYVPMNGSFGMGHPHFPYNMFNPYMGPACQTVHQPAAPGPTTAGGNADSAAPTSPEPSPTASKSPSTTSTTSPCGRRERKDSMRSNSSVVSYATAPQSPAHNENGEPINRPVPLTETQPQTEGHGSTPSVNANPTASSAQEAANGGKTSQTYFCPEPYTFGIRSGGGEVTEWYESHGPRARDAPPGPIRRLVQERGARIGCLHIHKHDAGAQTWMLDRAAPSTRHQKLPAGAGKCKGPKLEWKRVRVGEAHPRLRGLVLHFLKNGEPRWVRPASLKKYAKDNEKKKAIVVDDTAE